MSPNYHKGIYGARIRILNTAQHLDGGAHRYRGHEGTVLGKSTRTNYWCVQVGRDTTELRRREMHILQAGKTADAMRAIAEAQQRPPQQDRHAPGTTTETYQGLAHLAPTRPGAYDHANWPSRNGTRLRWPDGREARMP